jgi:hypothetical protein
MLREARASSKESGGQPLPPGAAAASHQPTAKPAKPVTKPPQDMHARLQAAALTAWCCCSVCRQAPDSASQILTVWSKLPEASRLLPPAAALSGTPHRTLYTSALCPAPGRRAGAWVWRRVRVGEGGTGG